MPQTPRPDLLRGPRWAGRSYGNVEASQGMGCAGGSIQGWTGREQQQPPAPRMLALFPDPWDQLRLCHEIAAPSLKRQRSRWDRPCL